MEKEKKGTDRGFVIKNPLPYAPENIHLKKDDFVKKDNARKAKESRMAEFSKSIDAESEQGAKNTIVDPIKQEVTVEPARGRGRPKKIE